MPRQRYQFKYRKPPRRRIRLSRVLLVFLVLAMLAYPFVEALWLRVEQHTVQVAGLHVNLRSMKIAFVSDIHQGRFFSQTRVDALVNTINGLGADIVILGGDYAEDSESAIEFFKTAPPIQARLGIFSVVGDTDHDGPESLFTQLVAEMKNYGCLPLVNNVGSVKVGQTYVYVAGVDDYYEGHPDIGEVASQVSKDDFVIFVGHTPDLLPDALKAKGKDGDNHWFDLALFGHTHGGQVSFLGRSLLAGFTPEVGNRYLSGWREENRASILVSNGVGTTTVPIRLFAPPQVHLITLKSK